MNSTITGLLVLQPDIVESDNDGASNGEGVNAQRDTKKKQAPVLVEDTAGNSWREERPNLKTGKMEKSEPLMLARVTCLGSVSLNYRLTSEFSRVSSTHGYLALIHFSNRKVKKIVLSKLDASPRIFLNILIQNGVDCPVASVALGHAVSEQFIRQAKDGREVYTIPGWNGEQKVFVAGNGIIKNGQIYRLDAHKRVLDKTMNSFVHNLKENEEDYSSFPQFPEHVFNPEGSKDSARELQLMWNRFLEIGIENLICAHVLMLIRTFLCIDDFLQLKRPYGMPFIFISGAKGSGKTETVGDLTNAYFFIERQNVSAGSSYPNARNKLCERALPTFYEEAHRRDTKCSLNNEILATDLRRLYRGSDLSNAMKSYKAIGFSIFDGINEGNLPADLKERIHFVSLPWSSKSMDESIGALICQMKDSIPIIQPCVVENLKNFTANPSVFFLSLNQFIEKWEKHLLENFKLKGRDSWPALVMAVAELTDDLFGWFEAMKAWLTSHLEQMQEHLSPRLEEFLEGLVQYDAIRPLKFETDQDIECIVNVPKSDRSIVRIAYGKAITLVSQHSSLGQNIHKKHLLDEIGMTGKGDKDPQPSIHSWLKKDRDKAVKGCRPKVLGGARFLEFNLSDTGIPECIKENLELLSVKAWPVSSPDGQNSNNENAK